MGGLMIYFDPDTTDQIYLGRSLAADVSEYEPYYFSEYPDRGNVISMYQDGDEWMAGADVPAPYGGFHIEAMDAHGGIVSKAETLTPSVYGCIGSTPPTTWRADAAARIPMASSTSSASIVSPLANFTPVTLPSSTSTSERASFLHISIHMVSCM